MSANASWEATTRVKECKCKLGGKHTSCIECCIPTTGEQSLSTFPIQITSSPKLRARHRARWNEWAQHKRVCLCAALER